MKDLIAKFEADQAKKRVSALYLWNSKWISVMPIRKIVFFLLQLLIVRLQAKPPVKRPMDFDDFNGNESIQKMSKSQFSDYLRRFDEVERIHDMRRMKKNNSYRVVYLVEFKDSFEFEWVEASTIKRDYPRELCEFYEQCITWE